jgi:hypothetical protein
MQHRAADFSRRVIAEVIRRWQNLTGRDAVRTSDGKLFREIEAEKEQNDER